MVLAPIIPAREAELRRLLDSMNDLPGIVNPHNVLVPFGRFTTLHFARFVILDDQTTGDVGVYGLPPREYPLYLAFLGDVDGGETAFLRWLVGAAPDGLRRIFSCCEDFEPNTNLLDWMKRHRGRAVANYINTQGRTVSQIHEEAVLRKVLGAYIESHSAELQGQSPRHTYDTLRKFVNGEISAGRLTLTRAAPTPLKWWIGNTLHLIGMPLLLLLALPFLLVILPFYLAVIRYKEKTDPEVIPTVDQKYSDDLALLEDHDVTNQFSAIGSLKPGIVRLVTLFGVLLAVDYAARHIARPGRLGRIRTIHFARWAFVAGRERMMFCSNYDGSVDSYMDDFINKTAFGLNASFGNGIGYPTTNWLIKDGCRDERKYNEYLRRHTVPTQVWYKAYPGLTAVDLERNTRIRQGLESSPVSDQEAREFLALL
jgi:hypothetical protein